MCSLPFGGLPPAPGPVRPVHKRPDDSHGVRIVHPPARIVRVSSSHTCLHAYTHAHTRTCTHSHTHTHTYTFAHTTRQSSAPRPIDSLPRNRVYLPIHVYNSSVYRVLTAATTSRLAWCPRRCVTYASAYGNPTEILQLSVGPVSWETVSRRNGFPAKKWSPFRAHGHDVCGVLCTYIIPIDMHTILYAV